MLDIRCSDVHNSHAIVDWRKSENIDPHIWKQIDGKYLYVLIRIEGKTKIYHTYYDIGDETTIIWLKEDGPVKISVFPFWTNYKLDKNNGPDMLDTRTFELNIEFQRYERLTLAFKSYESLITLSEGINAILYSANNPSALDHIFHKSFDRAAFGFGFAKTSKVDKLINWAFNFQPVDLCQRKLFLIPALLWIIIYIAGFLPLMFIFALVSVTFQIAIGVKWRYLNWELFKHELDGNAHISSKYRYNFSLSPLAFIIYGMVGLILSSLTPLKTYPMLWHIFEFSGLAGYAIASIVNITQIQSKLKRGFESKSPATANLYMEGKLTKSVQTMYTNLYQRGKRLACKSILKK
jgi:hypothetical protein